MPWEDILEPLDPVINPVDLTAATHRTESETIKLEDKLGSLERSQDFSTKLGAVMLEKAGISKPEPGNPHAELPIARTPRERRKLEKALRKADEVAYKRSQKEFAESIFDGNATYGKSRLKTFKERRRLHDDALRDYQEAEAEMASYKRLFEAGYISKDAFDESQDKFNNSKKEFHNRSSDASHTVVWQTAHSQNKARRRLTRAETRLERKAASPLVGELRRTKIDSTKRKIGSITDEVPVESVHSTYTDEWAERDFEADSDPFMPITPPYLPRPRESALDRLRRMRDAGLLEVDDENPSADNSESPPEVKRPLAPVIGEGKSTSSVLEINTNPVPTAPEAKPDDDIIIIALRARSLAKQAIHKGIQAKKLESKNTGTIFDEKAARSELEKDAYPQAIADVLGVSREELHNDDVVDLERVLQIADAVTYLETEEAGKPKVATQAKTKEKSSTASNDPVEKLETDVKVIAKEIWDSIEAKARKLVDEAKATEGNNFDAKVAWANSRRQVKDEAFAAIEPSLRTAVRAALRELDEAAYKARQALRETRTAAAATPEAPKETERRKYQREQREKRQRELEDKINRPGFSHPDIPN